jgi:hypothetical protein
MSIKLRRDKTVSTDREPTDDEPACACESPHGELACFDHYDQ